MNDSTGPDAITDVFLTDLRPERRRGIDLFLDANWLSAGPSELPRRDRPASLRARRRGRSRPGRRTPARRRVHVHRPLRLPRPSGGRIDLFPLPGVTPGLCGLYSALPIDGARLRRRRPHPEHLERGRSCPTSRIWSRQESFREAIEIADRLVLGRDNLVNNPIRRPGLA